MLVLTRRRNEEVVVLLDGHRELIVSVVENRDGKVRLGFAAPPEIKIYRREVLDAIRATPPQEAAG